MSCPGEWEEISEEGEEPPSWKDIFELKPPQAGSPLLLSPLCCVLRASHVPRVRDVLCLTLSLFLLRPVSLPQMCYAFSLSASVPPGQRLKFKNFLSFLPLVHTPLNSAALASLVSPPLPQCHPPTLPGQWPPHFFSCSQPLWWESCGSLWCA